jgi:inner membrane protein
VFIPFGAAIVATLVWYFCRQQISYKQAYVYALLGIAFSAILDACTSYGTHLLWPFSHDRISWNLIAIVDPVFTLCLLVPLIIAVRRKLPNPARLGILLAAGYMSLAAVQHERATTIANGLIAERGHTAVRHLVKPTLANILLWRSVYISDGRIHVDAVRAGFFSDNKTYPGESVPLLIPELLSSIPPDSRAAIDLQRFSTFSDGWLAIDPSRPELAGDARYAMLPNSTVPLWGVLIDRNDFNKPLQFVSNRTLSSAGRDLFMQMLTGQ